MRKVLLILVVLSFFSCKKEVDNTTKSQSCECGVIVQQESYTTVVGGAMQVYNKYKVKNDCTSNVSPWHETTDMHVPNHSKVGEDICIGYEW